MERPTSEEKRALESFLERDSGRGDLTSCVFDDESAAARIVSEEDCVISGVEEVGYLFSLAGIGMFTSDGVMSGSLCGEGAEVLRIEGRAEDLLRVERVALNLLSRMSGIATMASKASKRAESASPGTRVAGTRKTTPGLSLFEKRALMDGGALPHRTDLSSLAMLKDNHLEALGGGPDAVIAGVEIIRDIHGPYVLIEVEVEDIPCGLAAVGAGADIVMLDNFDPKGIEKASRELRGEADRIGSDLVLEASGGIGLDDIEKYAPHVDVISMGRLTMDAPSIGFRMDLDRR